MVKKWHKMISDRSQQQQRLPEYLPWLICPEIVWAANSLAMGGDAVFWFILSQCEISVTQLELINYSWLLCLFQESDYFCILWPMTPCIFHGAWNTAKQTGTLLGMQKRTHWEEAERLSLENHALQSISGRLLSFCLGGSPSLWIHPSRTQRGGSGGGVIKEGWVNGNDSPTGAC